MKKIFALISLLCAMHLYAQTINPSQIRPAAPTGNTGVLTSISGVTGWGNLVGGDGIVLSNVGGIWTISQGPVFAISSFAGGQTVEIGSTVTNPSFSATYTVPPTSASITNTDGIDSPHALSSPFTSATITGSFVKTTQTSTTFTLTAIGPTTKTATQNLTWSPRYFGGVGAAGATSSVTASGTNAVLSNGATLASTGISNSQIGTVIGTYSPSNQKVYVLMIGNSHTNWLDNITGLAMPFNTPTAVSFVNQYGATVSMYLYESTNLLSGTFAPKPQN